MRYRTPLLALAAFGLGVVFLACRTSSSAVPDNEGTDRLILIGLDGLRWDFVDRADTPALDRLVANGVRAERLVPVFPTKTFPNHHTIVTGLYPETHGMIANTMYDPEFDAWFRISDADAVGDGRWWGGEPVWVTVEKQGKTAAAFFWPGTEAQIAGVRPSFWRAYDGRIPNDERVDEVLAWVDRPQEERPDFITLYFSDVDNAAHRFGPNDTEAVAGAIRRVDAAVGRLLDGLDARGMTGSVNIVVASDHGMAATSPNRVVFVDDYVDLETANVSDWSPILALRPDADDVERVYRALAGAHPHLAVYRREEMPARYHYRAHRRIPPIIGIADEGWSIASRPFYERDPDRYAGGTHGYDPALRSMGATFIASGPAFRRGVTVSPFQNVHLYELLCHILGVEPAPNQGSLDSVRAVLR
jgi:predicted AlkP superfamily pyrophosphatase or phosphodiesterase